jgi:predicted aspartyl protease
VRVAFDESFDPPAAVLPVRVGSVDADGPAVLVHAIIDTGADCSVIPARVARLLKLPIVDKVSVRGFAGDAEPRPVFVARLRIGETSLLARILAIGTEPLLGRDILNQLVMRFDGPNQRLQLEPQPRRRARPAL